MAGAFNMLRPNDLIWSYVVNNYLKGKEPMPFDLLVWNSDSTRMPAANHSLLSAQLLSREQSDARAHEDRRQDAQSGKVTIPIYDLADARGSYRAGEIGVHRRADISAGRCAT